MSLHVYSELFVHLVWHTKPSRPFLTNETEQLLFGFIRKRIMASNAIYLHEIGGTDDHIHLALEYDPDLSVSGIVKGLRRSSSRMINVEGAPSHFQWQRGYDAVNFGKRNLPWIREYIRHQREHHANTTFHDRLERIDRDEGDPGVSEDCVEYEAGGMPI